MNSPPGKYPSIVRELLSAATLNPLGPGAPHQTAHSTLSKLSPTDLFEGKSPQDPQMAACCLSGLWLLHNFLDESHSISQSIDSPTGSYWHAIMHRREPDFPNAKYWCRRTGQHPVHAQIPEAIQDACGDLPNIGGLPDLKQSWDDLMFVDLCEQAYKDEIPDLSQACQCIARLEWDLLFEYCYLTATGAYP